MMANGYGSIKCTVINQKLECLHHWIISRQEGLLLYGITVYIANLKKCADSFLFAGSIAAQFKAVIFYNAECMYESYCYTGYFLYPTRLIRRPAHITG